MPTKPLLINSSNTKTGTKGKWHLFEQSQPYIQGIETGQLAEEITSEILNSLVSGIPSPWARARLFGFSFPYTQVEANIQTSGLIEFYERLVEEWKGFLACIALFPNRITISEPIFLDPKSTDEWFNIPSALGRMLFEDRDLWTDPDKLATDPAALPSIQLIYYAGKLVGATSPYSLLFTATDYQELPQAQDMPWYREGAFQDPIAMKVLSNDQIQKLYLLVKNITDGNFSIFEQKVNSNRKDKPRLDYNGLKEFLRKWKDEIRNAGLRIVDEGTLDADLRFVEPYYPLFNVKQTLYIHPNLRISFKKGDDYEWEIDPKEILLQEEYVLEFKQEDPRQPLEQAAVHYLAVPNPEYNPSAPELESEKLFFPIPFSEKGLLIFKNRVGDLIQGGQEREHELLGYIKPSEYKLVVELHLVIDNRRLTPIVKEYAIEPIENEKHVITWPNFVAEQWENYYVYSEFAESDTGTHLVPFFKNATNQQILIHDHSKHILYGNTVDVGKSELKVEKLLGYPNLTLDSSYHKYDIFRSNKPLAGLELRKHIDGEERVMGYLIVKNPEDDSMGDRTIKNLTHQTNRIDVNVGLDFGSNNSCIQYARVDGSEIKPIPFTNRRMFLVGSEVLDPDQSKLARRHELYFFQNESPPYGQIKSWLHEHYPQYITSGYTDQEISGGVAVFKPNIHIRDMNDRTISTNAGVLHHSMKWLTEQKDMAKKTSFLKMVWLKALADLYASGHDPVELRWSFPGSFTKAEELKYRILYQSVVSLRPIKGMSVELNPSPSTEAEAVSNYALTTGRSLDAKNVFLGIDVGGSTSDILIIAMDRSSRSFRLMKQSSVRLAAGYLTRAIKRSNSFRRTIVEYHNSPQSTLKIPNIATLIETPNTAPFFLNAIFDRLKDQEFKTFYRFLSSNNPILFALPAYMTGLLLYYSGQLVAKAIRENAFMSGVKIIDLFPFGKGGRIFDWLDSHPGEVYSVDYYNQCFRAGYGEGGDGLIVKKKNDIRTDNKSEVAIGLVSATEKQSVEADTQSLRMNSDIFGETGFILFPEGNTEGEPLNSSDVISTEHFEDLQFGLEFPDTFVEFEKFLAIYLKFAKSTGIVPSTRKLQESSSILSQELKGYIMNDAEFKKALDTSNDEFEYKHSMLVLEGMCYLEKILIPEIFKQ